MRKEGDLIKIHRSLLPLAWLYGAGVWLRNKMYDAGLIRSSAFDIPIISVGNITVGGTGKTPHVEYIVRLLSRNMRVAVLSRGYKRRTKGYLLADKNATAADIGDEPLQIKRKFGTTIHVAVDEDRCEGVRRLTSDDATKDVRAIILDDAFQHRRLLPSLSIVLIDYRRMAIYDSLLPAGRLREPVTSLRRADVIVVTKCPDDMRASDFRLTTQALAPDKRQSLFFSSIEYGALFPLKGDATTSPDIMPEDTNILLISGIASPRPMMEHLQKHCRNVTTISFPDHHSFSVCDLHKLNDTFAALPSPKIAVTTEKDAARLGTAEGLSITLRDSLFVLPIKVRFLGDGQRDFDAIIRKTVMK